MSSAPSNVHFRAWEWTPERKRCLELDRRGVPKKLIAIMIHKHRNTIKQWTRHPTYARALMRSITRISSRRSRRRYQQVSRALEVLEPAVFRAFQLAKGAVQANSLRPEHARAIRVAHLLCKQYVMFAAMQREDENQLARELWKLYTGLSR
jgi:hypothetical protein